MMLPLQPDSKVSKAYWFVDRKHHFSSSLGLGWGEGEVRWGREEGGRKVEASGEVAIALRSCVRGHLNLLGLSATEFWPPGTWNVSVHSFSSDTETRAVSALCKYAQNERMCIFSNPTAHARHKETCTQHNQNLSSNNQIVWFCTAANIDCTNTALCVLCTANINTAPQRLHIVLLKTGV